ncbi:hypothetical protein AURDEDRAFT_188242 [Auricularia subglabra TFB-10046 SS5]|nr:hypothetical protein AURDEDRAFT_188242 [Auricularia subglabra TFB-10046 SS5]
MPCEGALPSCAYFILGGNAILILYLTEGGDSILCIWNPDLQSVTELDCATLDYYYPTSVSSNGRWALVIDRPAESYPNVNVGYAFDLVARVEGNRFEDTSDDACFVPNTDTVVLGHNGSLCMCDVLSGSVLLDMGIDAKGIEQIAVSEDGATVVALKWQTRHGRAQLVHVWTSEGMNLAISVGVFAYIDLSPDGWNSEAQ